MNARYGDNEDYLSFSDPERNKYVEYLIQHGAKINAVSLRGYTPLDQCVFHSLLAGFDAESLLRLVQAGAQLKRMPGPKRSVMATYTFTLMYTHAHTHTHTHMYLHTSGSLLETNWLNVISVCVCERERENVCVCVCVCMCLYIICVCVKPIHYSKK